jgi:hypothetical protein
MFTHPLPNVSAQRVQRRRGFLSPKERSSKGHTGGKALTLIVS